MNNYDTLQRFLFENLPIRGALIHLNQTYRSISDIHPYPATVHQLLGQMLAASALLSASLKYSGSLILQTQSDGAVQPLVAQCTDQLHLRGMAHWDEKRLTRETENLLGKGHLGITIIPNDGKQRYQGVVALEDCDLATSIESYFLQSEQLATCICLFASEQSAHGLMLQQMPEHLDNLNELWEELTTFAKSLTAIELTNLSNEEILYRLFHDHDIRLFEQTPVCFRCRCSIEKMEDALRNFGKTDALELLKTHRVIAVSCEFCNRHYEFDKVDVERIFHS